MKQYSHYQRVIDGIESYQRQSPNYSLTGMFRHLRKQNTLDAFGDYPLIYEAVRHIKTRGNLLQKLRRVFALSDLTTLSEREKKQLIENLINI